MVWMTVFHFCFDLSHFALWPQNFLGDPFWTWQRTAIVSLFLLCAGMGQAIAWDQRQTWSRFRRRWLQVAAAALLVSVGSYLVFPRSYIYFGVLHGMAVMLVLARCMVGWGRWLWLAGGIALALPWVMGDVWVADSEPDAKGSVVARSAEDGEKGEIVIAAPYPYLCRTIWGDEANFRVEGRAVAREVIAG